MDPRQTIHIMLGKKTQKKRLHEWFSNGVTRHSSVLRGFDLKDDYIQFNIKTEIFKNEN
jgi:hypothetical protein